MTGRLRRSHLNLFRNQKSIVYVDPKISNRASDLCVAEQELDSPKIACSSVDHRGLGTPQGVRAVGEGIKADQLDPDSQ